MKRFYVIKDEGFLIIQAIDTDCWKRRFYRILIRVIITRQENACLLRCHTLLFRKTLILTLERPKHRRWPWSWWVTLCDVYQNWPCISRKAFALECEASEWMTNSVIQNKMSFFIESLTHDVGSKTPAWGASVRLSLVAIAPSQFHFPLCRDVARSFQRGVTLCQSEGTHQIVTMAKILSWHFRHLL